jgi:hypothetical protein
MFSMIKMIRCHLNKELQWPTMEIVSHNFSQRTDFPLGLNLCEYELLNN